MVPAEVCRPSRIDGIATLTIETSSSAMNPMTSETVRIRQRRGSGVYVGWSTSASGARVSAPVGELDRDGVQVGAAYGVVDRRQDRVPLDGERSLDLVEAVGTDEEPDVEVRRPVAPAVDVDATDAGQALDDADQPVGDPAELGGEVVVDLTGVLVLSGLQDEDERQAGGLRLGGEHPVLVLPDDALGVEPGARVARRATFIAHPGRFDAWRGERLRRDGAVDDLPGEDVPPGDRRGGQPPVVGNGEDAGVDLGGRLRHGDTVPARLASSASTPG